MELMPVLSDEHRYQILKSLEKNPNLSQRELAEQMGLSLGKVNFCLKALVEKGWVKVENFRKSQNKLGYAYILTPGGLEEKARVTVRFLKRKQREYEQLVTELEELRQEVELQPVPKTD